MSMAAGSRASTVSTVFSASWPSGSSGTISGFVCSFMSSGDGEGRALALELHVDGVEGALLGDLDQRLACELQAREEAHHEHRHAAFGLEELRELHERAVAE